MVQSSEGVRAQETEKTYVFMQVIAMYSPAEGGIT